MNDPLSVDLHGSLDDLARSVHDDELTRRLTAQVRPMVGRVRRRRAARATAVGAVSMGTVAAMTVGAVALANRGGGSSVIPPATDAPTEQGYDATCGQTLPPLPEQPDDALHLVGEAGPVAAYGEPVPLRLTTIWGLSALEARTSPVEVAVVDADGVVVATGTADAETVGVMAGIDPAADAAVELAACGGDTPLPAGDYRLVATVTFELSDGTVRTVVSDALPFTVTDGTAPGDDVQVEAAEAVADILAGSYEADAERPFGTCGSRVPTGDERILTIDLELPAGPYAPGALVEGDSWVRPTGDDTVLANGPAVASMVVLVRDGVVVAGGPFASEHVSLTTYTAANPYPLPARGLVQLCSLPGADAPELPLPAGTYQAYAVIDVALKEVQHPDGTAESRSETVRVRSEPVEVVLARP